MRDGKGQRRSGPSEIVPRGDVYVARSVTTYEWISQEYYVNMISLVNW